MPFYIEKVDNIGKPLFFWLRGCGMLCHHCGKDIPDGQLYCPYCGTSLSMEEERDPFHDNIKSFVGGFINDIRNGTVFRNIRTMHFNIAAVAGGLLCIVSLFLPCVVGTANGKQFGFSILTIDVTAYVIPLVISSLIACFASFSRKKRFGTAMAVIMGLFTMIICYVVYDMVNHTPPGITAEAGACMYVMFIGAWLTLLAFLFDLFVRKRIASYRVFKRITAYEEKIDAFGDGPTEAILSLVDNDERVAQEYAVLCEKLKNNNRIDEAFGLRLIGEFVFAHEEAFPEKDRAMIHEYASYCISIDENCRLLWKLNPKRKRISSVELKHKLVKGGKALVKLQFSDVTNVFDVLIKPTVVEVRSGALRRYLKKHKLLCVSIVCSCLSIISVFLPQISFVANGASLTYTGFQLDYKCSGYVVCFSFVAVCMVITRHRWFSIITDALVALAGWEMFVRTSLLLKMQYGDYVHYRFGLILLLGSCTLSLITVIFGAKINNKEYRKAKKAYKEASKVLKTFSEWPMEVMDDYFNSESCPEEIVAEWTAKVEALNNADRKGSRDTMLLALKDYMLFVQMNINLFPLEQQSVLTSYVQCCISACDAGLRMIKSEEE